MGTSTIESSWDGLVVIAILVALRVVVVDIVAAVAVYELLLIS